MTASSQRLSDIGEKTFIRNFIKPFFNSADDPAGVGDDCAMVACGDEIILLSTDRVPSDLTAFRLGLLDFYGMGDYLARLNLSDIAACGGHAVGLLLNLGLPPDIAYADAEALCRGFGARAEQHGATVLGGDITSASELSISATSIGRATRGLVLTRRTARPGDSIFLSRPLGLAPAAFLAFLGAVSLPSDVMTVLRAQFTDLAPMLSLGQALAASGLAGACMDNTDGVGQSLRELSEASGCAFIIQAPALQLVPAIVQVSKAVSLSPMDFIFNGGADFSLVGTIRGQWSSERATETLGHPVQIIGNVEPGEGVWLDDGVRTPLTFRGWNYFDSAAPTVIGTAQLPAGDR
jgi:thiamine-monophosphate kinase